MIALPAPPSRYRSPPQRIRWSSELWVRENIPCVACNAKGQISALDNNARASDFVCASCKERYQLKASRKSTRRITDGALSAMHEAFDKREVPSLLLMSYDADAWAVTGLSCLPGFLFPKSAIVARKPLGPNARRAGWQGCILDLGNLDDRLFIPLVVKGQLRNEELVRGDFDSLSRFRSEALRSGWTAEVLRIVCARSMPVQFTNEDVYAHKAVLASLFPENRNIEAKIRQQLQVLRDAGWIGWVARGQWRILR